MSPLVLWSIALGIAFLLFTLNSLWQSKTSASEAASGFILWQAADSWINYALYPVILGWLGAKMGFVAMFLITLIGNLVYIHLNNSSTVDWTLMGKFVGLPGIRTMVAWKIGSWELGKAIGFVFFSVKFDSFYAINYLYGKQADLRKAKIWILFLASHVICNVAWTLLLKGAFILARALNLLPQSTNF